VAREDYTMRSLRGGRVV